MTKYGSYRILIFIIISFVSINSIAQNLIPFSSDRGYDEAIKGDMLLIGNSNVGLDISNPYNGNGTNDQIDAAVYVDIDGDPNTFNSSSANLEVPSAESCYRIVYAGLYWSAVVNGSEPIADIKFRVPGGTYMDITGTEIYYQNAPNNNNSNTYVYFHNVTDVISGLANPEGTYTVANISTLVGPKPNAEGLSAGWSLFVVYEDPLLPSKYITSFDGFTKITSTINETFTLSGFTTIPTGPVRAKFAFSTIEGDRGYRGDYLEINGRKMSTTTATNQVIRDSLNFFNSSVSDIDPATNTPRLFFNRTPNSSNTLGFDAGIIPIDNPGNTLIGNSISSADISLGSNLDIYYYYFSAFAVDIIAPNIVLTKIVEDGIGNDIGNQVVNLGQELNYVIGFQNTGNDNATNFQIRDELPINIIFDPATGLDLPAGVTLASYNPTTRELIFNIEEYLVEIGDPITEIRIEARVVDTCSQLIDACSNIINNQAFASYQGITNNTYLISNDPSLNSNTGCLLTPQATNFLADLNDCNFEQDLILCGSTIDLTAGDGYDSYSWSTNLNGIPVIGNGQTITVNSIGTYYSFNEAIAPCQSIVQQYNVDLFAAVTTNPVIPFADEVVICPNDDAALPNIYLCGADDFVNIDTDISGATEILWELLDESCDVVADTDCANLDTSCTWNVVATGQDYIADTAGQYRLTIRFDGNCVIPFYFNVYENLLDPTVATEDIICTTPGRIIVNDVPAGYEYSLDGINFQTSNIFTINTPGIYTVFIKQIGVDINPCIFTVPNVQIRARDFTVSTNITQPLCSGDLGNIQVAANDAEPQYTFTISQGGTLINSIGPIIENNYLFENLNPGTYTITAETEDGCFFSEDIVIIEPPILTVTAALTTPLTCADGEITIYPQGGTAPYFYFINSITDFQAVPEYTVTSSGVYNITVVDVNNCSATTTLEVEEALPPDFTINTTDILCTGDNNGNITIVVNNANGSTVQYSIDNGTTFSSSPVFSGLSPGSYDVIIEYTLGGAVCDTVPQNVIINENTPIVGTAELTSPFTCINSGTITVTGVSGGTAPYSYSLDGVNFQLANTFTGLTQGNYTVTIQDSNGCTAATNDVVIPPLNPPTDLEFDNTPIDCPTNTTSVTITGVTGGTGVLEYQIIAPTASATPYQPSTTFSGLEPGTYVFQVRDENDCEYTESYTINPLPVTTVDVVLTEGLDCTTTPDALITGTITGTAPFTYSVSVNNGAFTLIGNTTNTFTYTTSTAGDYQFEITDGNGCAIQSSIITVNPITLPEITAITTSNPILCNGDSNGSIDVTINSSVGAPPFIINVINDTTGIDFGSQTTNLPAGDYTVTITDANSCTDSDTVTISQPDPIVVNYTTEDITCTATGLSDGAIIVAPVTGGTAPYDYYVSGTNIATQSQLNVTGTTPIRFEPLNFGIYQLNVIDSNGCSVLIQDILIASPPSDLDISITPTVDCTTGGEATITVNSTLASSGPFFFAIYDGTNPPPPNPAPAPPGGPWQAETSPGSTIFTGLTSGFVYTFIVYDSSTVCSYFETATVPIPTNSALTVSAPDANNITCTGSADGNVSFTISNNYTVPITVSYEIFDGPSTTTTTINGTGTIAANGTLDVNNLGPLPFGNYFVSITEITGPNAGCGIVTDAFNITESQILLDLSVSVVQNANCNLNSGIISAIGSNGTAPYLYQATTTATPPLATDTGWLTSGTFNLDANTYFIHVLDANGCIISDTIILPQDDIPEISADVNNDCIDIDGTFQIDVNLIAPGIAPYSISIDGGAFQTQNSFPFSISNLASGTHTVEINDANGCGNLVSVDILPVLDITSDVTALPTCNNDDGEITLSPTGGSGNFIYSISPTAPSISISGNVISGVPTGVYVITITDTTTNCTEEVNASLQEAIVPIFTLTPTPITCFNNDDGSFSMDIVNFTGNYTYEVLDNTSTSVFGIVSANTSTNPLVVNNLPSGTFTVVVTETDSPFCNSENQVIISSPAEELILSATETSNVSCNDGQGTITAIANGGWGSYEYELTGTSTVPYSTNGTFTNLSAGSYTVNVRDALGCIVSQNVTLEIPIPITATFTASTNMLLCFGDDNANITVTNVSGGQGLNYTYTLNTLAPVTSTSGPQSSNVFNNLAAGTYSVTINDGLDCDLTSVDITIDQSTQIEASLVVASTQTCTIESTLTLSATGGTGSYSYSEDASFTTVLGTFTNSITFSVPNGTYAYYVRDANGCISDISNQISNDPLIDLSIELESENPTISCAGDNNGTITATAIGGLGNYVYTLQDGMGNTINATQDIPGYFTELSVGDYVVFVTSGDCSTPSSTIRITEPDTTLSATLSVTNPTCAGANNGTIEAIGSGGTGIIKYAISPQRDQFFNDGLFENLEPGTYEIIVQDVLGCFQIYTRTITEPEQVILSLVPDSIEEEICSGDLDGGFSIDITGGTLPYLVSLDNPDGPFVTLNAIDLPYAFTGLSGGEHIVYVFDAEECDSAWPIVLPESVTLNPQVDVFYDCEQNGQTNTVTITVDDSITDLDDVDFSLNGGPYQASNVFTNVPEGIGYVVTVQHSNTCEQQTEPFDIVSYTPVVLTLEDGDINEIIINASGGTGVFTYTVNDIDIGDNTTYTIEQSGIFVITATDTNGCFATVEIEREFIEICIPNYFTPNGDGVSDVWGPGCIDNYPNLEFDIFDRYGRKVATYAAGEFWDGLYNGTELPTGDYWYVVRPNSDELTRDFVGHFTLYR